MFLLLWVILPWKWIRIHWPYWIRIHIGSGAATLVYRIGYTSRCWTVRYVNALIMHYAFWWYRMLVCLRQRFASWSAKKKADKERKRWLVHYTSHFNSSSSSCLLATISLPHSHLPRQQQNGLMWAIWLYGLGRGGRVVGTILAVQNSFLTPAYPSLCLSRLSKRPENNFSWTYVIDFFITE